jgi:hypothetical protein
VATLPRAVLLDEEYLFTNISCMKVRLLVNNLQTSHGLTGHSQEMSHPQISEENVVISLFLLFQGPPSPNLDLVICIINIQYVPTPSILVSLTIASINLLSV